MSQPVHTLRLLTANAIRQPFRPLPALVPSALSCRNPSANGKNVYTLVSQGGKEFNVIDRLLSLWRDESGQDIAEYAVMLAVILVLVVGTIRLIGSNANNVFSNTASSIQ